MNVNWPLKTPSRPARHGIGGSSKAAATLLGFGAILSGAGLTGCGTGLSQRGLVDAGAATVGGVVANKLTKGSLVATVAGAAGTGLVADVVQSQFEGGQEKRVQQSYDQGRSDATKQLYWAAQSLQSATSDARPEPATFYEVRLPEQQIDGVVYNATTKVIRINE